ncbi:MAG TPA: acyl carrier protein [Candidatus Cloacimonadota bacterium]|mgnify:CR=1 FL=1|nr:acyl carrier protein [Candidatus Cloacimonadota bacterium]HPT71172.1 acyl carrier protein [Candidatus Cloacimonadota bacterium]
MDRKQIVTEVEQVVEKILKHKVTLEDETIAGEVQGWDSLTHMEIIVAIEKHFNIKFSFMDIMNFQNMGSMFDCISNKLG